MSNAAYHAAYYRSNADKIKARSAAWYSANKEHVAERGREKRKQDPEFDRAHSKAWRNANPEKKKALDKAYTEKNKERVAERKSRWAAENKEHVAALKAAAFKARYAKDKTRMEAVSAKYRQQKRVLVPWFDRDCVTAIYALSKVYRAAGVDCHVDHIVPLRGKTVSGLHVQGNLSVVPAQDNFAKGARTWPDMPR